MIIDESSSKMINDKSMLLGSLSDYYSPTRQLEALNLLANIFILAISRHKHLSIQKICVKLPKTITTLYFGFFFFTTQGIVQIYKMKSITGEFWLI